MDADLLEDFVELTGSTMAEAMKYMKLCDDDLNAAVGCYFDPAVGRGSGMMGENEEAVRAPIAAFTDQINEQVGVGRMGKRPSIVFEDGDLGALFKAPTDLSFVGTLETAKIKGRNRKKWLLVNVQDKDVFQSQLLNRDLWCLEDVRDVIERHFVFWQIFRDNLEGEHFVKFYKFTEFPCICIIDPNTGEMLKQWGFMSHDEFMKEMHEFTLHYRFESGGRRKSFDFYGLSRVDFMSRDKPTVPVLEPTPDRSPTPSPPPSPEPQSEPESEPEPAPEPALAMPDVPADVSPGTVHVTFRLPDGARHTGVFQQDGGCSELYRWLAIYARMENHNVMTAFPRVVVTDDEDTSVKSVVGGGARAMLIVAEKED